MISEIKPQPGKQEAFLSTPSDICVYGGAAGGGKSYGLLLEPLRHIGKPGFTATIFRRTYPQIRNPGGLWDTAEEIYPYVGGSPRETDLSWSFPAGNNIKFAHLEHEKSKYSYQGSQICFIGFDELTLFSESQFFYLLSRNRSTSGISPYIRCTCNPDSESWVSELLSWYIDQETGYPIQERSGILRYFIRYQDRLIWGNSRQELWEQVIGLIPADEFQPKSFTFIPASLEDNPALTLKDPGYRSNLLALSMVDRERLLQGNWKIRPSAGNLFKLEWFKIIDYSELPINEKFIRKIRYWDTAATEPDTNNKDPDYTAGVLMGEYGGQFYIFDLQHIRKSPAQVEELLKSTSAIDGKEIDIGLEQEPGSAGKREAERLKRTIFQGYSFRAETVTGDKVTRAKPLSSAAENGLIYLLRAPWNYELINELIHFPDPKYHDDIVDSCTGAFNLLTRKTIKGTIDLSKIVKAKTPFLRL